MISVITVQGDRIELPYMEHETIQRLKIRLHDKLQAIHHLCRLHLYSSDRNCPWKANDLVQIHQSPYFVVREVIDSIPKHCLNLNMEPLPDDRPCFWKMKLVHECIGSSSFGFSLGKDDKSNMLLLIGRSKPQHVITCDLTIDTILHLAYMPHMTSVYYQVIKDTQLIAADKFKVAIGQSPLRLGVANTHFECSTMDVLEIEKFMTCRN